MPVSVFCSYSHRDERYRERLSAHLSPLVRQGVIAEWNDRKLVPGEAWEDAIDGHLNAADIILLLVSADFIKSEYCYSREMTRALERHRAGVARVIPIVIRHVDWTGTPIASLQALPTNAKPINTWRDKDKAWLSVVAGIRIAISEMNTNDQQSLGSRLEQPTEDGLPNSAPISNHLPDYDGTAQANESAPESTALGKQKDDNAYAAIIHNWALQVDLDGWSNWSSWVLSPDPHIPTEQLTHLESLPRWLLSRIWPGQYPDLEASFANFRRVLSDFVVVFSKYIDQNLSDAEMTWTRAPYKGDRYFSQEEYDRLSWKYDFHVDLVHDLCFELTRAANYICDRIRECVDPQFRLEQGALLVSRGPNSSLRWDEYCPQYRGAERCNTAYPGLADFLDIRSSRDISIGQGRNGYSGDFPEL